MSMPCIVKIAIDPVPPSQLESIAKRQSEADKLIPTYKEMRAARLRPDMPARERMAYRAGKIQSGYIGGTVGGGILGGLAGTAAGALLEKTRLGRTMPGTAHALKKWILPATIGYTGYRAGAIQGRKAGERYARNKLITAGSPVPYIDPISMTDRGASDPIFMGSMMGAKTMQAAISEKSRDKVESAIKHTLPHGPRVRDLFKTDAATMKNFFGKTRRLWRK